MAKGKSLPVGHEKKGTWLEIHDEQGNILPEGEQGEIIIIGDTVSTGYFKRDDLTEKPFSPVKEKEKCIVDTIREMQDTKLADSFITMEELIFR